MNISQVVKNNTKKASVVNFIEILINHILLPELFYISEGEGSGIWAKPETKVNNFKVFKRW